MATIYCSSPNKLRKSKRKRLTISETERTMRFKKVSLFLALSAFLAHCANQNLLAQQTATLAPSWGASYADIKSWHQNVVKAELNPAERIDALRSVVSSGPYGRRGLNSIFKNFEGGFAFDPTIPGVENNLRLTASQNANVRKGAARTHLYQTQLQNDSRFKLLEVNQSVYESGRLITDRDIAFQHRATGLIGRIEVKDISLESQRSSLEHYKVQINKMAAEMERTGQPQAWVNRREVSAQLRQYANSKGIPVYENVVTGERPLRANEVRMDKVLDDLNVGCVRLARSSIILSSGTETGLGLLMLVSSAPATYHDAMTMLDPNSRSTPAALRLGQDSSLTLGGLGFTARGTIGLAAVMSETAANSRLLMGISRWAGRAGWVGVAGSYGFVVFQYANGTITEREFMSSTAAFGGGLVGGAGGGWAGGWIGGGVGGVVGFVIAGPPGVPVGATIGAGIGTTGGAIGGGYLGANLASNAVNNRYQLKDAGQQQEFQDWLLAYYGNN
jgi:hypothetical protein